MLPGHLVHIQGNRLHVPRDVLAQAIRESAMASMFAGSKPGVRVHVRRGGMGIGGALPADVLERIFRELSPRFHDSELRSVTSNSEVKMHQDSRSALRSAALVCRTWCPVAMKFLYNSPYVDTMRRADLFYGSLCGNDSLPSLVSNLVIFRRAISPGEIPSLRDFKAEFHGERILHQSLLMMEPAWEEDLPPPPSCRESDDAYMADCAIRIAEKCFGTNVIANKGKPRVLPRATARITECTKKRGAQGRKPYRIVIQSSYQVKAS